MTRLSPSKAMRSLLTTAVFFLLVCPLGPIPSDTNADTRGITVKTRTNTGATRDIKLYSDYHALVVERIKIGKKDRHVLGQAWFFQDDRSPVTCVSWNDAQAFISWLSREDGKTYRLPTEAE